MGDSVHRPLMTLLGSYALGETRANSLHAYLTSNPCLVSSSARLSVVPNTGLDLGCKPVRIRLSAISCVTGRAILTTFGPFDGKSQSSSLHACQRTAIRPRLPCGLNQACALARPASKRTSRHCHPSLSNTSPRRCLSAIPRYSIVP